MMELRIVQGSLLKNIIEAIKELQKNVIFHFSPIHGVSLHAVNSSQVASVELLLPPVAFQYYRCNDDISMRMNLDNVATILKCSCDDDIISIEADDGSDDTVTFIFESPTQDKISNFKMNLMEIEVEDVHFPEGQYHATVRMPSAKFARICKDLRSIGEYAMISVTMEGVWFSTEGDIGNVNILCNQCYNADKPEESTVIEMNELEPMALSVHSRYLNSFTKAAPLSRTVTISLSNKLPLIVEYKIDAMSYIRFCAGLKLT